MKTDLFAGLARKLVHAKLGQLTYGELLLEDTWCSEAKSFGPARASEMKAVIRIKNPAFYVDLMCRGSIGAAEAWVEEHWDSEDPIAVVRLLVRNRKVLNSLEGGMAKLSAPLLRLFHAMRRNTRGGSKKNIAAHYDLGNDFFELFLDPSMTYSSAIFERPNMSLEEASIAKLDRLCRKLDLQPDDHLLEIGTGWGSMAIHAAENYGCRVTTTTISRQQYELARERVKARGLEHRIELLERDYRDLEGQYDKLVSVEMIEAVGHQFLGEYLQKCSDLLRPDGAMALQVITMQDQEYDRAKKEVDFIKRYIFPGSFIPSLTAVSQAMTADTDLRFFHMEDFGPHYAETLRRWREKLHANRSEIIASGYEESFLRLWDYYLCYCAGGFDERLIGVAQVLLTKPQCRIDPILPSLSKHSPAELLSA
ncbi:MAG: class I SAM-dependent methyltransferase [Planctomycetota bacterium]|jgi:cyclopropane-fatty-acyl-phospholipid synthase